MRMISYDIAPQRELSDTFQPTMGEPPIGFKFGRT